MGLSDEQPFDDAVLKMSQEWVGNASVAVLFGHLEEGIGMMRAIEKWRAANHTLQDITWIASDGWAQELPEEHHETARGMLGVLPQPRNVEEFRRHFVSLSPQNNPNNP